jgi:hypothetical protein
MAARMSEQRGSLFYRALHFRWKTVAFPIAPRHNAARLSPVNVAVLASAGARPES